ncbi:Pentatricopeptide repeat-containing protein [Hibiscus syriacus]|uniref:Pentatricopeptide repeat-containing protein n=1 Tax=Hibiscus syriacus TaxID=106335 RepID=A0A6A3AXP4_HIBSY|nr:pentatricopeptide repeat-containing protein At4g14820-like [Hibiscus syriacus]KAE8708227.1 Pentatricopeptide repeat-containing protein [Hibiscus syriacus]
MSAVSQLTISSPSAIPTPTILLKTLSYPLSLTHFKQVHAQVLRSTHPPSHSLLLKLLLSSPSLPYSLSIFSHLPNPLPPLSTPFLRHLSRSSNPQFALLVYQRLRNEGMPIDRFAFPPLLKAAARAGGLAEGKEIHGFGLKSGLDSDPFVQTGVMRLYVSCRRLLEARLVFDRMSYRDVVAWSIMIDGYCQSELFDDALELFEEMKRDNIEADNFIFSSVLSACGHVGNLDYGKAVHDYIIQNDRVVDAHLRCALVTMYTSCGCMDMAQQLYDQMMPKNMVVSTAMISGYSRHGRVLDARLIFDQMVEKDLVCWSAMISCYAESDQPQEALRFFNELQTLGIRPDQVTVLSVISACAHLGVLDKAKWIHVYADKNGFGGALAVNNALIDMYAKCGSLERARDVFERMRSRNVISWSSMINAFAMHGDANNALSFFHKMKEAGVEPNRVTFVGVLYACSHAGLVEEGRKIFASMINEHMITPTHEHYGCMVDLFGRANLLREAVEIVETMPFAPNVVIWGSLMSACRMHAETELGESAAKRLLEIKPDHHGALVLLSNIYAKERKWQDVGDLRQLMKERGIYKERGCSRIELNNEVHEFLVADRNHKQADEIYKTLDEVVSRLKSGGYAPNIGSVLVDLEEEEKKEVVLWHSEKLALCYGLINGERDSCIRIIKNLRVCEDCHTFMKLVSKVYGREIVVRDRTRFHHYRDGVCSCRDYW